MKLHHCWHCEYGPCNGLCTAITPPSDAYHKMIEAERAQRRIEERIRNAMQLEEIERLGT